MNAVEEYREMAEIHAAIDYGDSGSVKQGNRAADSIRKLGQEQLDLNQLTTLLASDHPASLWAAHHLLEFHDLTTDQRNQAVRRIEIEIAKGGAAAMGERMFLAEFAKPKR